MLTNEQLDDLAQLHEVAEQFATEVTIIGAAALLCFIDIGRFTRDVDLAVALDLEDFATFSAELKARGWTQARDQEHRWHGPRGSLIDLVPAGPGLRAAKRMVWPESQFAMSLVGFEHVFARSVLISFRPDARHKVAPPPVIALLKVVAHTEDPNRRRKDLDDLKSLLRYYEAKSDRIFDDDVLNAELEDIEYANAFLLGSDVGAIATQEDAEIVSTFLRNHQMREEEFGELDRNDLPQKHRLEFHAQLQAFAKGFNANRQR